MLTSLFLRRARPLFPKWMIIPQILVPITFLMGMGIMSARHGAFAWNGAVTFWVVSFGFLGQIWIDTYGLWIATLTPALEGEPLMETVCVPSVRPPFQDLGLSLTLFPGQPEVTETREVCPSDPCSTGVRHN